AIWTLEEAVKTMGSVQLGIEISDEEAKSIINFLGALDGKIPAITYPELPVSSKKTPKPEL
ncbi:MAG: cytochrome C biogenesis protein CcsA, partial [Campylobacteraceae bacterium]|nr:cytochrome C biogenesis protein CcsA [Campylobacteraceae bacterium]